MIARTHDVGRIGVVMLAMTAALAVGFMLTGDTAAAASAAAGGVVAVVNLHLLRAAVSRLISAPRRPMVGVLAVLAKLVVIVSLVAAAFSRLPVDPLPFALGASVLFAAVLLDALFLGSPIDGRTPSDEHRESSR